MNLLKELWQRTKSFFSIIISTASLLSILVTLLAFLGIGSATFGYNARIFPLLYVGLTVIIISGLLIVFVYTFALELRKAISSSRVSPTVPTYPDPQTDGEIELVLKEIVYQHLPTEQQMRQRKRFKVRALRDGVTSFADRYLWTGSGPCIVKSLTGGFTVVNQRKEEFWNYFDVRFPHAIRKDDELDFTIEWELDDTAQNAVPFLSTMIDYETKHLAMRVILPPELAPKGAFCYEFSNYIEKLPISTIPEQWDPATQSINYDVSNPKKNHKYLIRWYS